MNALEIKDLCKGYSGFMLDHLNLTLPSGCIMGLIGENGAGKSTTIKLILDMIQPDSGSIRILGKDSRENSALIREDIGVALDEVGISECLTAVQVGKIMKGSFQRWEDGAYEEYLTKLSIPKDKSFKELSKGMKMKLGIAVALSHKPKLLILDEATSGLDPVARDEVLEIFNEFTRQEDHAILISSHIVGDLEKICDYIAFLHKGKLLLCEEKDRLAEEYGIVRDSREKIAALAAEGVISKRESPYGTEAVVKRKFVPAGLEIHPVDIEQLFVCMVKEGGKAK